MLTLNAHIDSFDLKAKISPAPVEAILNQNPQLYVECNPVLTGAITGLTIIGKAEGLTGSDIIKALAGKQVSAAFTGNLDYALDGFDIPLKINATDLKLGAQTLTLVPHLSNKAIGLAIWQ